jgi:hypothetical protein
MAEEREEQEEARPNSDSERRVVARFLDLIAAGFVALAATLAFDSDYKRAFAAAAIGLAVFLCGIYWDPIRRKIGPRLSGGVVNVASSGWAWGFVLLLAFLSLAVPSLIDRITKSQARDDLVSQITENRWKGDLVQTGVVLNYYDYLNDPVVQWVSNLHWWSWRYGDLPQTVTPFSLGATPSLNTAKTMLVLAADTDVDLSNIEVSSDNLPQYAIIKSRP